MTSVLSGATGNGTEFGGYVFADFVQSWAEFARLRDKQKLEANFGEGDFVSRFGGLATLFADSELDLWHYYQDSISLDVDTKSGIVSMVVRGYDPDFTHALSKALLADAVTHLTSMNRQRENQMVRTSLARMNELNAELAQVDQALAGYRTRIGVFEPEQVYNSRLALLNQLALKQTELKAQYASARRETPNSPAVTDIATALSATSARIEEEQGNIQQTSKQAALYDNLKVRRENTVRLLSEANSALHEAQRGAVNNGYFLNVISEPSNPRVPELPNRLRWIVIVFAVSLLVWGILR